MNRVLVRTNRKTGLNLIYLLIMVIMKEYYVIWIGGYAALDSHLKLTKRIFHAINVMLSNKDFGD